MFDYRNIEGEQRIDSDMQEELEYHEPAPQKRRILLSKRFIDGAQSLSLTNLFNKGYERD